MHYEELGIEKVKILFLHLSDIHIEKSSDIENLNPRRIADAISNISHIDDIIMLISGDIAYSGERVKYDSDWNLFGTNSKAISCKMNIKPKILMVPGNHDVNYGTKPITHQELQGHMKGLSYESAIPSELQKIYHYKNFSNGSKCYNHDNPLLYRKELDYDGYKIEVNLLNSAIFSSKDEDKCLHYMPQSVISELESPTDAEIAIAIMCHSHHWFCNSAEMEVALYAKNSIIFYGHEHRPGEYDVKSKGSKVKVVCGGELSNRGNWDKSSFNTIIFDTEKHTLIKYEYSWNIREKTYVPSI